jgi:hypothetical protein
MMEEKTEKLEKEMEKETGKGKRDNKDHREGKDE